MIYEFYLNNQINSKRGKAYAQAYIIKQKIECYSVPFKFEWVKNKWALNQLELEVWEDRFKEKCPY